MRKEKFSELLTKSDGVMSYLVNTKYFGISKFEFCLLRSGFAFKKISNREIKKIVVKKGVRTKHPVRTLLFGVLLIIISYSIVDPFLIVFKRDVIYGSGLSDNTVIFSKGLALIVVMIGFLFAIGIVALIHSIKKVYVLEVHFESQKLEVFTLKELPKPNGIFKLIEICKEIYGKRFENQSNYSM